MSQGVGSRGNPNPSPETRIGTERGPKMGAPFGNQNGRKGFRWRHAIESAIDQWAKDKGLNGSDAALESLARCLLKAVAAGDISAVRELGDRLDGKPKQTVEHEGSVGISIYKPDVDDAELG